MTMPLNSDCRPCSSRAVMFHVPFALAACFGSVRSEYRSRDGESAIVKVGIVEMPEGGGGGGFTMNILATSVTFIDSVGLALLPDCNDRMTESPIVKVWLVT